jgi:putative NADPH-quinone reductase
MKKILIITAHILTTLDQPAWYYGLIFGKPSVNQLKKSTLEFCGVKPVKVSYFGPVKSSDEKQRQVWLKKAEKAGSDIK